MAEINEIRIVGPPGTGKTNALALEVTAAAKKYGSDKVMVASLTRTAAAEIAGRNLPLPRENVGTLHAHAYRTLGGEIIIAEDPRVMADWNTFVRDQRQDFVLSAQSKKMDLDDFQPDEQGQGVTPGDLLLSHMNILRARMVPQELWTGSVQAFFELWTEWKMRAGVLDFTDLLEFCISNGGPAGGKPDAIIVDEAQDCSALELALCRAWASYAQVLIMAGDSDQCQPEGTMVLTSSGERVAIEKLNPDQHRIASFDRHDSAIYGAARVNLRWKSVTPSKGFAFRIASRLYHGPMYQVSAGGKTTRMTPNHRVLIQWDQGARSGKCVTYLMKRGNRYRVGWCQLFQGVGGFHLGIRARMEKADAAWVLGCFSSRAEASRYESVIAAKYGLTTILFEPRTQGAGYASQEDIDAVFSALDPIEQKERAERCLRDHWREPEYPIYSETGRFEKKGHRTSWTVHACNIIPGLMMMPVEDGKLAPFRTISITRSIESTCRVYSLEVEPHHTYVADGLVVGNCLFSFRGSQPGAFFEKPLPPGHVRILEQSYRVPRTVHRAATQWISLVEHREQAAYLPRPADGQVLLSNRLDLTHPELVIDRVEKLLIENKDEDQADAARPVVALLTTCGYMLEPLKKELSRRGIPYHNPWRRRRADWNPLFATRGIPASERLLAFLRPNEAAWGEKAVDWTAKDIRLWLAAIKTTGLVTKRGKDRLMGLPEDAKVSWEELVQIFDEQTITEVVMADLAGALTWYEDRLGAGKEKGMAYPLKVARVRGPEELRRSPRVVISTVHASKGGEAKWVMLWPNLSPAGDEEYRNTTSLAGGGRVNDSVYRLFYVGMTRAREGLLLCPATGSSAVRWLRG